MTDIAAQPSTPTGEALHGLWHLKSRTDIDSQDQRRVDPVLGADPLGILCFAGNRFAAQFMKRDRSAAPAATSPNPNANNTCAIDGYDAYFGTYTLDESASIITVLLEGSISPNNIGKHFTRKVRVSDNELTIQLSTNHPDGTSVTRTLLFSRVS